MTEKQPDPAHGVEHKPHGDGLTPEVRALREERRTESFYDAQITYRKSIPALRPEVAA